MQRILSSLLVFFAVLFLSAPAFAALTDGGSDTGASSAADDSGSGSEGSDTAAMPATAGSGSGSDTGSASSSDTGASDTGASDTGASDTGSALPGEDMTDEEMLAGGKKVVADAKMGEWALVISGGIMLLLALARRFKLDTVVPSAALPWLSAGLGVLAAVAVELSTGGTLTLPRVLEGVLAGMAASGAWSLIGRHLPWIGSPAAK